MVLFSPGYINSSELMENIEENYEYWKKKLAEEQEAERKLNSRGEKINKLRAARERRETEPSSPSPTHPTSPASPASTITSDIHNPDSNSSKSEPGDVVSPNPEKVLDPVLATSPTSEKVPSPVPSNPLTPELILDPAPSWQTKADSAPTLPKHKGFVLIDKILVWYWVFCETKTVNLVG